MRSTRLVVSVVVCLLLLSARTIFAQAALDCATLVDQSFADFGKSCQNLANGVACYGHKSVTAQTNNNNSDSFLIAADQLPLNIVENLSTSAANPANGDWGLALANMLPAEATTPVIMMLMGDANFTLVPTAPTSLQIGTGFAAAACDSAPSIAAIETTSSTPVTLKINGIAAQATSLVVFQQESANAIKAIVYSGTFAINGGATAQAGQTLAGVMDNKGTILFWSAPRPSNDNEAKAAAVVVKAFTSIGIIQPTPVPPPPTATPIPPTAEPAPASNASCGEGVTHVIQPGENLYRIALRYGTSIGTIQEANHISDANQIVVGQTLVIPCGKDTGTSSVAPENNGSQPTAAPSDNATPVQGLPTTQTIDCNAFNGSLPPNAPAEFKQLFNQFCSNP